jgi:TRAP-type C4-dicarboxylate transport system substrate-binding protein
MTIHNKGLLAALMLSVSAGAAASQELTLRVADSLPVGHYIAEGVLVPLMAKTTELTGGNVAFEHFPAQQLGKAKDMLSLVESGVADIAYVGASYVSDKLPLSSVGELPEAFTTACEGTAALWQLAKPGGALDQAEYAPEGVRVLAVLVLPPYQVFSATEMTGIDSLSGMKIRATGAAKQLGLTKLGAVPVAIPGPETREALSRGTVDAIAFPHASVLPYDLVPHLKSATDGGNYGSFVATFMIAQSKYDGLPAEVQAALTEAGELATQNGCKVADDRTGKAKKTIQEGGVEFVVFSDEDMAKISGSMAGVGDEWAAGLDERGKPGSDVLAAFRAALEAK